MIVSRSAAFLLSPHKKLYSRLCYGDNGKSIAKWLLLFILNLSSEEKLFSQSFVDVFNGSLQGLNTHYKDLPATANQTSNIYLNVTLPIKLDSHNYLILKPYFENLASQRGTGSGAEVYNLYSGILPIGIQHETRDKKWQYLVLGMPKLSSDFVDKVSGRDFQMGGYGVVTYRKSENLKIKFGVYYNSEFFGTFIVPLAAVDWKVNSRLKMYGIMPINYRIEYNIIKGKLSGGFAYKGYTRTYRLSSDFNHGYVRNNEILLKLYLDYYVSKHWVLFAEFGRTILFSPLSYFNGTKDGISQVSPIYFPIQDAFLANMGLAYRINLE